MQMVMVGVSVRDRREGAMSFIHETGRMLRGPRDRPLLNVHGGSHALVQGPEIRNHRPLSADTQQMLSRMPREVTHTARAPRPHRNTIGGAAHRTKRVEVSDPTRRTRAIHPW